MNKIVTLGDLDIIVNGQSIIDNISSKKRLFRLFKYFLIHNDSKVLPEKIIDDLWADEDFKDPLNVLRGQISRIRKAMNKNEFKAEFGCSIDYMNGYYMFKVKEGLKVDFIQFEEVLGRNPMEVKEYIEDDYLSFKDILLLYNGAILEEIEYEHWLMPTRNRLDRLYVRGLLYYIDYLKENLMYNEIIEICEKAIEIKPYEESINIRFMEALMALGQDDYALMHYEILTRKLFNDLEVVPSIELTEFHQEMNAKGRDYHPNISLNTIDREMLNEFNSEKPGLCDLHYFKFVYNFEKVQKNKRTNTKIGIGLITIESQGYKELTEEEIKEGTKLVIYILMKYLKPGDIISKWNESQTLMLLYRLKEDRIEDVLEDINDQFNAIKLDNKWSLNIKMRTV